MLSGALAEGFGLLMIVPLATIAIRGADAEFIRFAPWAESLSRDQRFVGALALFVAAMALRSLFLFTRDVLLARLSADYGADLSLRATATLARRGWPFASRIGQSGMQSLLLNDVPRAQQAVANFQNVSVGASMLLVQLVLTWFLSPALTAFAAAFLAAAFLLSLRWARRGVLSGQAISEALDDSADTGFRLHAGLKAALAQGTVAAFMDEYRSSLQRTAGHITRFARDYSSSRQLGALAAALLAAALLLIGVRVLHLPFPVLIASLILFARMSGPAQQLQSNALQMAVYAPAFAAMRGRLGDLERAVAEPPRAEPLDWQQVELDCVTFEHRPGFGVRRVSLRLRRGEWLAVSGASGGGKTTLVDLVAGLLAPTEGRITIDGRNMAELLERWRGAIAYVGQEGNVFNDSVRGNLLAEGGATDERGLWQALELVGLAERIRALPHGLDELVGDRGSQLSGGERQRLVLARAVLRKPSLLILDEATAALDQQAEARLIERLQACEPRPAAILVAHRESTLSHCDSVLALQHEVTRVDC
jgi:ATP-binding cassette subfamily C protein